MKKFIVLLLFVSFCGGTIEETLPPIETTTTSSTVSTTTSTTTTTSSTTTTFPETTTTTVNIEDVILPTVTFPNCPEDQVTDSEFQLIFEVTAGNYGVDYLRFSRWKNGEYESRAYFEKANPNSTFDFPLAEEVKQYSVLIENDDKTQLVTYELFVSISDESNAFFEIEERCKIVFNNIPTTTTSTTTTTTTIPPTTTNDGILESFSGNGDNLVFINFYSDLIVAEITGNNGSGYFQVKPFTGELPYSSLVITTEPYSGVTPVNFSNNNPDTLEVTAVGDWSIVIKSVSSTPIFSGNSISGSGDTVIQFPDNAGTYQDLTINGNKANGYFQVKPFSCTGLPKSSLVITADEYNGTVRSRSGTCYLVITAVGEWSISR